MYGVEMGNEPKRLKDGKVFERKVKAEWADAKDGVVRYEDSVLLPKGRKGRRGR